MAESSSNSAPFSDAVMVTKSPQDEKEYRVLRLDNGLRVLLVSDRGIAENNSRDRSESDETGSESDEIGSESEETGSESEGDENVNDHGRARTSTAGGTSCNKRRRRESQSSGSVDCHGKRRERVLCNAACGLCVHVGSFHDPLELPGLAHLLEHMLFMGSDKYPGENEFDSFVSCHGGSTNASTDYETTLYSFEVSKKYFQEALDKFAQFFVCPLLMESSLEREIEAVDSEFYDSYQSDRNRLQQLFCSLALSDHPLRNFPCGNRDTLKVRPAEKGIDILKQLRRFYEIYYSASYMTLTVVSEDLLDTLELWVRRSFSDIPTNMSPSPSISHCQPVFEGTVFHRLYRVVPVKDVHRLSITWLLPSVLQYYREKPIDYLSSLIGHEGYGSVLSLLKRRNLATILEAGSSQEDSESNSCYSLFNCSITLTDKGMENVFEVISIVFQYIKMLQTEGPQERIFNELQLIEFNDFEYNDEEENIDLVEKLCLAMQFYSPEDYLTGDSLYFTYNPEIISSILNLLIPQTCNIFLVSQQFKEQCHDKEQWYNTSYTAEEISLEWETAWRNLSLNPNLYLPQSNNFIASDFTLVSADVPQTEYPVTIKETPQYRLWYKKDNTFELPKASICSAFFISSSHLTLENTVLIGLFVALYDFGIMESGYEAITAGLDFSLELFKFGLSLRLHGFSHKLSELFKMLVTFLATFEAKEEDFIMAKERLKADYNNFLLKPHKICRSIRLQLLEREHFPVSHCIHVLDKLTLAEYMCFTEAIRSQLFVETLVQGNMTAKESENLMEFLCSQWNFEPLSPEMKFTPKCLRLPSNTETIITVPNKDDSSPCSVFTDYYQCSVTDPREEVLAELLTDCMSEPCFDILRTKKQLGYTVYVTSHNTHKVTGLSLTVVTQKYSEEYVSDCMREFISEFVSIMESWDEEKFLSHVDALIDHKEEDDPCLNDEVERNWSEILNQTYLFGRLEKQVVALEKITKTKACRWLKRYTKPGDRDYRKLTVKILSQQQISLTAAAVDTHEISSTNSSSVNSSVLQSIENNLSTASAAAAVSAVDHSSSKSKKKDTRDTDHVITLTEEELETFKSTLRPYPRGQVLSYQQQQQ